MSITSRARTLGVVGILVAVVIQWTIVAERSWAAGWAWYKFSGEYGGGGHITVGVLSQLLFYVFSVFLIGFAFRLSRPSGAHSRFARVLFLASITASLVWTAILISPLAVIRPALTHHP